MNWIKVNLNQSISNSKYLIWFLSQDELFDWKTFTVTSQFYCYTILYNSAIKYRVLYCII